MLRPALVLTLALTAGAATAQQCSVNTCGLYVSGGTSNCSTSSCRAAFGCFCDSACEQYGDCCSNYVSTCAVPQLSGLSPTPLPTTGATLTLSGTQFGADAGTVSIGASSCPVSTWSNASITCAAGPGQGASTPLTVTSARGLTATSTLARKAPHVNEPLPTAPTSGGQITLLGTDFGAPDASVSISAGTVQAWTQSSVTWNAPAGVGSTTATLIVAGQPSNTVTLNYAPPSITNVTPASLPAGGGLITLTGTSFGPTAATFTATVGGLSCTSPTMLVPHSTVTCTAPAGLTGAVPVRATVAGAAGTTSGSVTYPGPTITSMNPPTVATTGGSVIFNGTGLSTSGLSVTVGGQLCSATSITPTSWTCNVQPGVGTDLPVAINVGATSSAQAVTVSYTAPTIANVSPNSGSPLGGTLITLMGLNFSSQGAQNLVFVGTGLCLLGTPAAANRLTCTTPAGTGTQPVVAFVGGQRSNAQSFTYDAPTLTSVTTANTNTQGGATLTLSGNNFGTGGARVTVDSLDCPLGVQQNGFITCTLPQGAGGTVDVVLTLAGQQLTKPFTWGLPTLSTVTPAVSTKGAALITLTGSNFGSGAATSVSLGTSPCSIQSRSHQQLVCSAPPGQGTVTAVVTVAGATASTSYTYAPPVINLVTPSRARTLGGTLLTITGDSFGTTSGSVSLGGTPCVLRSQGHTQVRCDAPAGEGANLPLVVTVGGTPSAAFPFSYEAPVVDVLQPTVVPTRGGFLWISGRNFGLNPSVTVGGVACPVLKHTDSEVLCSVASTTSTANVDVVVTATAQPSNPVTLGRQGSCGVELAEGAACDDGVACTGAGHCVGTTCVRGAANDEGVACDDGDPCSTGGTCRAGVCSAAASLDGGEACVASTPCAAAGACVGGGCGAVGAQNGLACDDGNPLTTGDGCASAQCIGDAGMVVVDAGVDAGTVDAGEVDAGEVDAGTVDAGDVDAGELVDAGATDAGLAMHDAGTFTSDAGTEPMPADAGLDGTAGTGCGCNAVDPGVLFGALALLAVRRRRHER